MDTQESTGRTLSFTVQLLVCCLGLASWIDINGLWVELPLMVHRLPEHWNLPSYLVIITQISNIGPLTFTILSKFTKRRIEIPTNYFIISVGAVSCLLLSFLWYRTTVIWGMERSTALLTLALFLALVDCTSSVSFLAFMSLYPAGYMTAYLIGEEVTGLIPSLVGLIQGSGGNAECLNMSMSFVNDTMNTTLYHLSVYYPPARFPVKGFLVLLFTLLLCSLAAFVMLNNLPSATRHRVKRPLKSDMRSTSDVSIEFHILKSSTQVNGDNGSNHAQDGEKDKKVKINDKSAEKLSTSGWLFLMIILGWLSGLKNAVLPSIQSYSALPYGNVAYHLCITLSQLVKPLTCFVAHYLPTKKLTIIGFYAICGTLSAAYIFSLALLSPTPILCGSKWGEALMVVSWILFGACVTYVEVVICFLCRSHGRRALIRCGFCAQFGSFIGSVTIFSLMNSLDLFTSNNPCDDTCYN